jgi:hypothetical protein
MFYQLCHHHHQQQHQQQQHHHHHHNNNYEAWVVDLIRFTRLRALGG